MWLGNMACLPAPISEVCFMHCGCRIALVRISAICSGSRQFLIVISCCSTSSLTQCHQIAMCLLWLWNCGFFAIAMELLLSPLITVGLCWGYPSSSNKFCNEHTSCPASDRAMYSACIVERAILDCFLDFQVIAPPAAEKTYPDIDLWSSWFA